MTHQAEIITFYYREVPEIQKGEVILNGYDLTICVEGNVYKGRCNSRGSIYHLKQVDGTGRSTVYGDVGVGFGSFVGKWTEDGNEGVWLIKW